MRSRVRLLNEPPLLDPERAIRLVEDAQAFLDAPGDGYHELTRLAVKTAMDAAHVAIETAIDTGDPHVLAAALPLATKRALGWGEEHFEYEITSAAGPIFPAVTEITNRVRDCARSRSSFLRAETAKGLGPRALRSLRGESPEDEAELDAEAANIVFALTKDKNADVRAAAREALGGAAPPAWATFFPRDPLAKLPAAEAARHRGPLDRAAEALEKGVGDDAAPLAAAIAELPDDLAAPILDAWMRTPRAIHAKNSDALIERWLSLDPDGERTMAWLRAIEGEHMDIQAGTRVGVFLKRRPAEQARAIGLRAAAYLKKGGDAYLKWNSEQLLEASWPAASDPTALLEVALGAKLEELAALPAQDDGVTSKLAKVALGSASALEVVTEPFVDAFLDGFAGRWADLKSMISERLLEVSHPRLRAHAETQLREGEGAALGWALRYLTKGGHDPSVDPPVEQFLTDASRDPRLRAVISQSMHLRPAAQAALRAQLVRGELPPEEALAVAKDAYDPDDDSSLSAEEWAVVRRAREAIEDPDRRTYALNVIPPVARWTEEDRKFVDSLIEGHGHDPRVAMGIAIRLQPRLSGPAQPELVPILERLLARSSPESAEFVEQALKAARGEDPY